MSVMLFKIRMVMRVGTSLDKYKRSTTAAKPCSITYYIEKTKAVNCSIYAKHLPCDYHNL